MHFMKASNHYVSNYHSDAFSGDESQNKAGTTSPNEQYLLTTGNNARWRSQCLVAWPGDCHKKNRSVENGTVKSVNQSVGSHKNSVCVPWWHFLFLILAFGRLSWCRSKAWSSPCSPSWRVTSNAPLSFIARRSVVISKSPVCSWVPRTFSPTSPRVSHRESLRGRSQARQQEKSNADFYATLWSSHRGARRTELKIKRKHKSPRFLS